jgi:hypothetical protein
LDLSIDAAGTERGDRVRECGVALDDSDDQVALARRSSFERNLFPLLSIATVSILYTGRPSLAVTA